MKTNSENKKCTDSNVATPIFNYRCKKCGSTYTGLKSPLKYSSCIVEKPLSHEKCNGVLVSF